MKNRSKKLNELNQTHGKIEDTQHKTLDQIWGDDGSSRYKQQTEQQYLNYVSELNKSDLQAHANKLGLIPVDNRELLTKRLLSEYKKFMSAYKIPAQAQNEIEMSKDVKNILSEGK
jgi:hypothetical protein